MNLRDKALDTWNKLGSYGAKKKTEMPKKKVEASTATPLDKLKENVSDRSTAGILRDADKRRRKAIEDAGG